MIERVKTLIVEDNAADIELLKIAFAKNEIDTEIIVKTDGEAAIDYLLKLKKRCTPIAFPKLVILDLNLPKRSGKEVLEVIKRDCVLKRLPVIIMSTSDVSEEIESCYELHSNAYLVKPNDFNHFLSLVQSIKDFWYERNKQF
ncbi:response regulator [Roseivirga sp.]|uniref:response regulator n=1 Tax=Roseivirga sp. TaxID=1964215 RepID=UPI003B518A1E